MVPNIVHKGHAATEYVTTANVNLRKGVRTNYKIVIPKGKQAALLLKHDSWYKIRYSGKTGYASSLDVKQTTAKSVLKANNPIQPSQT